MTIKTLDDLRDEKLASDTATWDFDDMARELAIARWELGINAAKLGAL